MAIGIDNGNADETIIQEWAPCADCGKRCLVDFMEGKWCEDCFDIGLKADMNAHFAYNVKKEMEEK